MMPPLLSVDGLRTGYGRIEVLHEVSFGVPAGSVVALLGANGAGKTTALRAISGTLPVWGGSVKLDGRRIDGRTPHAISRQGLTLVPEGRGVFPALTVREHLVIAARAALDLPAGRAGAAARAQRVDEVLDAFPALRSRLPQHAGLLSGGEQQMLAMSRAFIARPRLLLLDEISMGLAPLIVDRLYDGVRQMRATGITLLLVEQYLTHALRVADLCFVMAKGRVVFVGEPGELRSGGAATAGYLSSAQA
jgi:branched-chain amino acid transport system ATP-binding protein